MRWTVFLQGERGVFSVCPVIPPGALAAGQDILAELLEDTLEARGTVEASRRDYLEMLGQFTRHLKTSPSLPFALEPAALLLPETRDVAALAVAALEGLQLPVLVTASRAGELSVYVLSRDLQPAWRNSGLIAPEALVVEQLRPADCLDAATSSAATRLREETAWTLQTDPLHSHCLHVVGGRSGAAFLVSLNWLVALRDWTGPGDANRLDASFIDEHASSCVPVHLHAEAICGAAVVFDPFLGHHSVLRVASGLVSVVNLTVHLRLCRLQRQLEAGRRAVARKGGDDQSAHWETLNSLTDKLLAQVLEGLASTPLPSSSGGDRDEAELLGAAMSHLEKRALLPLEDVAQRIQFRAELSREVHASQLLMLEGGAGGGLHGALEEARRRQQRGRERLQRIREVFERQRELAACALTQALMLKSKVSSEERQFHSELEVLRVAAAGLDGATEALRQQARQVKMDSRASAAAPGSPYAHLVTSPAKSPLKQVEWFSRRRIAGGAGERPMLVHYTPVKTPAKQTAGTSQGAFDAEELADIKKQLKAQVTSSHILLPVAVTHVYCVVQSLLIGAATESANSLKEVLGDLQDS